MSYSYLLAKFVPNNKNKYRDQDKWYGSPIGLDTKPFAEDKSKVVYKVSNMWKHILWIQNINQPPFDFIEGCDLQIRPAPIKPGLDGNGMKKLNKF